MSLSAKSNSLRCETDTEHQTGEQYSKQGKIKYMKGFEYCIIITKNLATFANQISVLGNKRGIIANMFFKS